MSCNGTLTATATGGTPPYTYYPSQSLYSLCGGTYSITVTDSNGCTKTVSATITNVASNLAISATTSNATCGLCNGTMTATATGGMAPYTYSPSQYLSNLCPGSYTITVIDSKGCTKTVTKIIASAPPRRLGRCDRLLVTDGAPRAVVMASARLADFSNVQVRQAWVPSKWPAETFDLIVLSEFGFYLGQEDLDILAEKALRSLRPGGTVLACHWRRPIEGCEFNGDEVHHILSKALDLTQVCQVVDPDMLMDVWCSDARSVAQHEGFA